MLVPAGFFGSLFLFCTEQQNLCKWDHCIIVLVHFRIHKDSKDPTTISKPHVGFAGGGAVGAGRRTGEGWPGGHGGGADGGGLMARDVLGGDAQAPSEISSQYLSKEIGICVLFSQPLMELTYLKKMSSFTHCCFVA